MERKKNLRRHIKYVYVFQCRTTGVIKIGVSGDPVKRLIHLNYEALGHTFELVVTKEFPTSETCFAFEKYLHKLYAQYKVITGDYGGYTEIFSGCILSDLLENFKSFGYKLKRIDPYLILNKNISNIELIPLYENNKDCYGRILADLWMARLNGFDGIYCTSHSVQYSGRKVKYLEAFNCLSKNNILMCKDFQHILNCITIEDISISYKDKMLYFLENATLTYITQTLSVMEYFSSNRGRFATLRKILRKRGLTSCEVDAMMVAYKQVMKSGMNCRVEIK